MSNQSIGALWRKEGARGEFFTGNVEIDGVKHEIVAFWNTQKQPGERTPDLRILPSTPREGGANGGGYAPASRPSVPFRAHQVQGYRRPADIDDLGDAVPF